MMTIKDLLLAEYDHEVATTRRLLDRLDDAQLAWRPHDRSMSLGGLGTHLATIPGWSAALLNQSSFDLEESPRNSPEFPSRAAILDAFDRSTRQAREWMHKTDGEYQAAWTLKQGDHVLFSMPRVTAFRSFVVNHMIHHRGQLSVYLRLTGALVPAIYGPSADEG
jgi:uncharacterized damage-inducible protein DinB